MPLKNHSFIRSRQQLASRWPLLYACYSSARVCWIACCVFAMTCKIGLQIAKRVQRKLASKGLSTQRTKDGRACFGSCCCCWSSIFKRGDSFEVATTAAAVAALQRKAIETAFKAHHTQLQHILQQSVANLGSLNVWKRRSAHWCIAVFLCAC